MKFHRGGNTGSRNNRQRASDRNRNRNEPLSTIDSVNQKTTKADATYHSIVLHFLHLIATKRQMAVMESSPHPFSATRK